MSRFATLDQFHSAPIGYPFIECCGLCGLETGTLIIKKKGRKPSPVDPEVPSRIVISEEARCEFCTFLGCWFSSTGIDPKDTGLQYGVAKLVTEGEEGERDLVAFVPFSSQDTRTVRLMPLSEEGDTSCTLQHGMVILVTKDGETALMRKVLEPGV